jgi:hypothetical protein
MQRLNSVNNKNIIIVIVSIMSAINNMELEINVREVYCRKPGTSKHSLGNKCLCQNSYENKCIQPLFGFNLLDNFTCS